MMKIKLKEIKIFEPDKKIKIGLRFITQGEPVEPISGTTGLVVLIATLAGNAIVGDATQIDE